MKRQSGLMKQNIALKDNKKNLRKQINGKLNSIASDYENK
jgi:hypothetical protein